MRSSMGTSPVVILAMGRGIGPDGESNPATDANAVAGYRLLDDGEGDILVFSGGYSWMMDRPPAGGRREADNMMAAAAEWVRTELGLGSLPIYINRVRTERIIPERDSIDTVTNMVCSKLLLAEKDIAAGTLVPVSIPGTQLRSGYIARKVFGPDWAVAPSRVSAYDAPGGALEQAKVRAQEAFTLSQYVRGLCRVRDGDHEAVLAWHRLWLAGMRRHLGLAAPQTV